MQKIQRGKGILTFSIAAFDPATGDVGVAVASKFLAVGSIVPWVKAGVGAIATQAWANPAYGEKGLKYLSVGMSAEEALRVLTGEDQEREVRQVGIVDARGGSATFTGSACYAWAGGIHGAHFAVQGNVLAGPDVVERMAEAFASTSGELADRLYAALAAGDAAGGDKRGKQSAAIVVERPGGGYGGLTDRYLDLRVDDHTEPVRELGRLMELHALYYKKPQPEDIVPIDAALRAALIRDLAALGYLPAAAAQGEPVDDARFEEALMSFQLIENLDERIQPKGYIDRKVVSFLRELQSITHEMGRGGEPYHR
ncbi:MAG: DUF1028 domain-containing protein [Hydrogenibacillus sp.]|nr:DUF1028 domain-containing protein [Hydrogenibacillus sp.]